MSTRPSRLSLPSSQATASAKTRWISSPMMRMPAPSVLARSKRELAGNTTPTDPRSQRIRASRKGRPCNELGLSAHRLSAACPHFRAPGAPRPRRSRFGTRFLRATAADLAVLPRRRSSCSQKSSSSLARWIAALE